MIKGLLIPCHSGQCSLIIFLTVPAQNTCKISFSVDVSDGKTTNIKISSPVAVEQLFRFGSLASFSRNIGCTYRLNSGIPDQVQEKIRGEVDLSTRTVSTNETFSFETLSQLCTILELQLM